MTRLLPILALVLCLSSPANAEIYRWEDPQGTIHFTDDESTIPPQHRDKAKIVIHEPPPAPGPAVPAEPVPPAGGTQAPAGETGEPPPGADELQSEVEQLRARIAAKEKLIRSVEEKRAPAANPYKNRFVDQPDLDLYDKYQSELPGDQERLKDLEDRLNSLR